MRMPPPDFLHPDYMPGLRNYLDTRVGYVFGDTSRTTAATNGGVVQGMTDRGTAAKHWAYTTTAPTWNSGGYLVFDDTTAQYGVAGANTDFKFLHDGTGCTVYIPFMMSDEKLTVLFNTGALTNTHTGMSLWFDDSSTTEGAANLYIANGSGTYNCSISSTFNANVVPAATPHVAIVKHKTGATGGEAQLKIGNCPILKKATVSSPASGNSTYGFKYGESGGTLPTRGRIYTTTIHNQWHTPATERNMVRWFRQNILGFTQYAPAFLGDSITAGIGISGVTASYPELIATAKGWTYATRAGYDAAIATNRICNYGVSGAAIQDNGSTSTGNNVYVNQWNAYIQASTVIMRRMHNQYVILAGINDIISIGRTGAQCLSDLNTLVNEITAWDGNQVILCTLTPCDNYGSMTDAMRTHLRTLNAGILAKTGFSKTDDIRCVDVWNSSLNDGQGSLRTAYDSGDKLHPSQAGMQVIADLLAPFIGV